MSDEAKREREECLRIVERIWGEMLHTGNVKGQAVCHYIMEEIQARGVE